MRSNRLLVFVAFVMAALLLHCENEEHPDTTQDQVQDTKASSADRTALREAYQQQLSQLTDTMPVHQTVEEGKLYPVDEALSDTAFFVFRERLLDAVAEKDIFTVMEAVDENIKAGFGGEDGPAGFAATWGLESEEKTQQSKLWEVLEEVLRGGGTFQEGGRRFVAPYIFSTWPEAYDAFTHAAVTGSGVRVREQPSLNSRIMTMVSYNIVELLEKTDKTETIDGVTYPWIHLKTLDGTEGYLWGKFVRSPISYRAGFENKEGEWKMVFLVAGD